MSRIIALIIFGFIGLSSTSFAQEKVNWMTFEEALEKMDKEKRKIFVDMYTDWCGWCKKMDMATFQQPHIAKYLNENFYPVKFNAEQKEEITYDGETYKFVKYGKRGYHQLAAELVKPLGRLSFPTIVFIDTDLSLLQPIPGFQTPDKFEVIMTYFAEDHYKNTPWKKYFADYTSSLSTDENGN